MSITRIGRYEVEKELGRGAMAVVYKAVDPAIGRVVAIKTIRMEHGIGLEQDEMRQRFYREAQSAGNLNHPSIVTIYDIAEEGALSYIAMEFVEGMSLEDWMEQNRIPPLEATLSIIEQIASGLDYAAARGIIHRDIKPGNILLTSDMRAKIADFGIAKFSTSKFTQTGALLGTPAYMSPEQALGKTLDGRSDIFSLGIILYEMLVGERPFIGSNSTTIIYKIVHEQPVPPCSLNVTLHQGIDYIVQRMLAKDPDQRYQSCGEVIEDLRNYAALGSAKSAGTRAAVPVQPAAAPGSGRRYGLYVLVGILVVAIGILSVFLYEQMNQRSVPAQGSASAPVPATASAPAPAPAKEEAAVKPVPPAIQPVQETAKRAAAPEKVEPRPAKQATPAEKPGYAEIQIQYGSTGYAAALYDGAKKLQEMTSGEASLQVLVGDHNFHIVSDEVFLDQKLAKVRLKAGQVHKVTLPGLSSAYIEVPGDAYNGCEILLDGRRLPPPYPAQIKKLAAGDHKVVFRWSAGKYAGKEIATNFSGQESRLYRVLGEPQNDRVLVQQVR